jgi:hypothetical protein
MDLINAFIWLIKSTEKEPTYKELLFAYSLMRLVSILIFLVAFAMVLYYTQ